MGNATTMTSTHKFDVESHINANGMELDLETSAPMQDDLASASQYKPKYVVTNATNKNYHSDNPLCYGTLWTYSTNLCNACARERGE